MRGEFIRGDGLVIPNNITMHGARTILAAALTNEIPTFFIGLVDAAPQTDLTLLDVIEPNLGLNGYARQQLERSVVGWPTEGILNDEPFFESKSLTFVATDTGFNKPIRRLMLCTAAGEDAKVLALSTPLPEPLTILPTTPEPSRRFKYRIYL